jgi:hypothetical protein
VAPAAAPRPTSGGRVLSNAASTAAKPALRSSFDAPVANRILVPTAVQVQTYRPSTRTQHLGFWGRLRRVFFGVTEPEAGA